MAEEWKIEACPACKGAIIWAVNNRFLPIALDAEPSGEGSMLLRSRIGAGPLAVVPQAKLRFGLRNLRTDHLKTCIKLGIFKRLAGL